jgi:hypothetical protein
LGYNEVTDRHTEGHHLVRIDPSADHSYWNVTGPDDLCTDCDFPFAYSRDMIGSIQYSRSSDTSARNRPRPGTRR